MKRKVQKGPIREMHLEIAKFHTFEPSNSVEHFLRAKPINQAMTGWLGPRALTGLMSLCCLVSISIAAQPDMSDVISVTTLIYNYK